MGHQLDGKKIALLVDKGFEQIEMTEPRKALEEAGADTDLVSPEHGHVRGWNHTDWGDSFEVDVTLHEANPDDYDALVLPGGVMNPDHLRMNPAAVTFVRSFIEANKPIAAICHGPWTLIEAGGVKGKRMTSYPSLQTDLRNAGATWEDREVVLDDGLVTSRKPDDLPAFNQDMVAEFARAGTTAEVAQGTKRPG